MATAILFLHLTVAIAHGGISEFALVIFNGTNGGEQFVAPPFAFPSLVQGRDGNFYGTTTAGGQDFTASGTGLGTVFKVATSGKLLPIWSSSSAPTVYILKPS